MPGGGCIIRWCWQEICAPPQSSLTGAAENLDILAGQPLWDAGLDYNHGTGHGVGDLLVSMRVRRRSAGVISESKDTVVLEAGMVISDEPGLYLHGKYGIRLENLLACEGKGKE